MYPNPLVVDLMATGIADRIAQLRKLRVEPNADIRDAFARLERELDDLASAVTASVEFLQGRNFAPVRRNP